MPILRFSTAGESHGRGVLAVIEGLPAGLELDLPRVDAELQRRQGGYGRSRRMVIEEDRVEVLAGWKRGRTLGSPLALWVGNRDHRIDSYRVLRRPRPGHADLAGALKYGTADCADVMERASARETAARVAAGAVARQLLERLGIQIHAEVVAIGPVELAPGAGSLEERRARRDQGRLGSGDPEGELRAVAWIDRCREAGESSGGAFLVEAHGVPAGLGSPAQWDLRLDGRLAQALMSIPGIKAVEVGVGVGAAHLAGSEMQDALGPSGRRVSNRAGGIEGGMSNGEAIRLRATMKAIPSLRKPLPSLDLGTGEPRPAVYERSDVCAVPAASVVGEAAVGLVLLGAVLEKCGGDSLPELVRNWHGYLAQPLRSPAAGAPGPVEGATGST
jgi:chorismate synthase